MNTCVIGGNGFIGQHLVKELIRNQRNVTVISRSPINMKGVGHIQVQSLYDPVLKNHVTNQADEIICLAYATKPKTSFDNPIKDLEENLSQTVHLFELAASAKRIKKVLYVSSGGAIYGNTDHAIINENHITKPISPYGITKMAIEHYAHLFFTMHQLPITIVRPSNAYGPGQMAKEGQGFIAYAMEAILNGTSVTIFGETGTVRDYIYIDDLVKALFACLISGKSGETYNAGTQQGFSNLDILSVLQNITSSEGYMVNSIHKPIRLFDVNRNVLDIGKIIADTGWRPVVNTVEGLKNTWNWFRALQQQVNPTKDYVIT